MNLKDKKVSTKTFFVIITGAFVLIVFLIIANSFPTFLPVSKNFYGRTLTLLSDPVDYEIYFIRSQWVIDHLLPYKDVWQEYPPLASFSFAIPYIFTENLAVFKAIYSGLMVICFIGLLLLNVHLLRRFNKNINYIWLLFLPSVLFSVFNRFDALPALLGQLSLYLLLTKKEKSSFFVLGLAALTKIYSIIFILPFLVFINHQTEGRITWSRLVKNLSIFLLPIVLVILAVALYGGLSGLTEMLIYHFKRAAGSGSLYSFITGLFVWHGSLFSQKLLITTYWESLILGIVFLFATLTSIFLVIKAKITKQAELTNWLLFTTLVFILFSRFYSVQWILWFLPLFILVIDSKKELILLIIFDVLNYLLFPVFMGTNAFSVATNIIVVLKSIVLIWLITIVFGKIKSTLLKSNHEINTSQTSTEYRQPGI